MDYLQLLQNGALNPALSIERTSSMIQFICFKEAVCKITTPTNDELHIEQLYTFPLHPRALDTGVQDLTKCGSDRKNTAGGFGDGFKSAAVALLANDPRASLKWIFTSTDSPQLHQDKPSTNLKANEIIWTFGALAKERVGRYAACRVLQVHIERKTLDEELSSGIKQDTADSPGRKHIMRQVIKAKGIGETFWKQVLPRMQIFWNLDTGHLISSKGGFVGENCLGNPIHHSLVGGLGHPESGVYVRGIFVRPSPIKGTMMCFSWPWVNVNRDRNDIREDTLTAAVAVVFLECSNMDLLRTQLSPLKGRNTKDCPSPSWFVHDDNNHFLDRVLKHEKEYILNDVLQVPQGAIFVSWRTKNLQDPFINWAISFLKERETPIVPITKGSNRYLFVEVHEVELKEKCANFLLKEEKKRRKKVWDKSAESLQVAARSVLKVMKGSNRTGFNVLTSRQVKVAFIYNHHMFLPMSNLTREFLFDVLKVCASNLSAVDKDAQFCLMQTLAALPKGRTLNQDDVQDVVRRTYTVLGKKDQDIDAESDDNDKDDEKVKKNRENSEITNEEVNRRTNQRVPERNVTDKKTATSHESNTHEDDTNKATTNKKTPFGFQDILHGMNKLVVSSEDGEPQSVAAGPFAPDMADEDDATIAPQRSKLYRVAVEDAIGGGMMMLDMKSKNELEDGHFDRTTKKKIAYLRSILSKAKTVIADRIPALAPALKRIRCGYDSVYDCYGGFFVQTDQGPLIMVNYFAYLSRMESCPLDCSRERKRLLHDMILVVAHEMAHFAVHPYAGHGPLWRTAYDKLVCEIIVNGR